MHNSVLRVVSLALRTSGCLSARLHSSTSAAEHVLFAPVRGDEIEHQDSKPLDVPGSGAQLSSLEGALPHQMDTHTFDKSDPFRCGHSQACSPAIRPS